MCVGLPFPILVLISVPTRPHSGWVHPCVYCKVATQKKHAFDTGPLGGFDVYCCKSCTLKHNNGTSSTLEHDALQIGQSTCRALLAHRKCRWKCYQKCVCTPLPRARVPLAHHDLLKSSHSLPRSTPSLARSFVRHALLDVHALYHCSQSLAKREHAARVPSAVGIAADVTIHGSARASRRPHCRSRHPKNREPNSASTPKAKAPRPLPTHPRRGTPGPLPGAVA